MGSPLPPHHLGHSYCPACRDWKPTQGFYLRRNDLAIIRPHCRDCRDAALLDALSHACAEVFYVAVTALGSRTRGEASVARARQALMYLLHTRYGWSQRRIAAAIGRDRKTVGSGVARAPSFLTPPLCRAITTALYRYHHQQHVS